MFCFPKTNRLLKKKEYDFVFQQAQKVVTKEFIFLFRDNLIQHARLGLAISKKVVAKAHDRNRLKRLIRETFRQHSLPAVDIVVLARPGVSLVANRKLIDTMNKTWDKLVFLCER